MSVTLLARSPVDRFLQCGAPAKATHESDLLIVEQQNLIRLQVIARNNVTDQLSGLRTLFSGRQSPLLPMQGALHNGVLICATGPREYWI